MRRARVVGAVLAALVAVGALSASAAEAVTITVYGTSDVTDSNLLAGLIVPGFQAVDPADTIDYHAQGSGAAITSAENPANHVDVLMVHSPPNEAPFVAGGFSGEPLGRAIFYNDYVIVGPRNDPAGVLANFPHDAVGAYQAIAAAGGNGTATFVTRNDNSGTNVAEQQIWGQTTGVPLQQAIGTADTTRKEPVGTGGPPSLPPWYKTGANAQGANLDATNACAAATFPQGGCYTMVDRGTYLFEQGRGNTNNLEIVSQSNSASAIGGQSELTNPFHAYLVKTGPQQAAALKLLDYLTSPAFQAALVNFPGNGQTSVFPDAFAQIGSSSIPTHATAGSPISISATLLYAPPVARPIAGMPVQLQASSTGAPDSYTNVGSPVAADGNGVVTLTTTMPSTTTFYRLSMDTFDSTALASRFSPNTNSSIGTQSGRVDVDAASTPTPTPTPKPSNLFGLSKITVGKHGAFALKLKFPAKGKATITAKAKYKAKGHKKAKTISFIATRTVHLTGARTVTVHFKPGKTGASALRHARKLKLTVSIAFTPTGGTKRTRTTHLTVRR